MSGNPKDSPWYSTPRHMRRRKPLGLTLPEDVLERLDAIARVRGVSRSEVIADLVRDAPVRRRR